MSTYRRTPSRELKRIRMELKKEASKRRPGTGATPTLQEPNYVRNWFQLRRATTAVIVCPRDVFAGQYLVGLYIYGRRE